MTVYDVCHIPTYASVRPYGAKQDRIHLSIMHRRYAYMLLDVTYILQWFKLHLDRETR